MVLDSTALMLASLLTSLLTGIVAVMFRFLVEEQEKQRDIAFQRDTWRDDARHQAQHFDLQVRRIAAATTMTAQQAVDVMRLLTSIPAPQIGDINAPRCCKPTAAGALCPYVLGHAGPCYQTYGRAGATEPTLALSAHEGGTGNGWAAVKQLLREPSILIEPEKTGYGVAVTNKHW